MSEAGGEPSFFSDLSRRHEALKKRIHSFRMPLGPVGRTIMGFIYFSIPMIGGYYIMEYAKEESRKNIGSNGEELKKKYFEQGSTVKDQIQNQNKAFTDMLNATLKKKEKEREKNSNHDISNGGSISKTG